MKLISKQLLILVAVALLQGCGSHKGEEHGHDEHGHEQEAEEHEHAPGEIVIEKAKAAQLGIGTTKVASGSFRTAVHVSGEILPARGSQTVAVAKSSGIIRLTGNVSEGVAVVRGQNLGNVSAAQIVGGDENATARIDYDAAKKELDRLRPLYEAKIVSAKDYQEAEAAFRRAANAYKGNAAGSSVSSPLSGVIDRLFVEDGAYVEVGASIASITENRRLTLRADVPSGELEILSGNASGAVFRMPNTGKAYDTGLLGGRRLSAASPIIRGGYAELLFSFNNPGGVLPGSLVDVYVKGPERQNVVSLPMSAISEEQGYYFVYVKEGIDHYEKRRVDLGGCDGLRYEIRSGLKAGEEVVTTGTVLVRIAANTGAIPEGHHH